MERTLSGKDVAKVGRYVDDFLFILGVECPLAILQLLQVFTEKLKIGITAEVVEENKL